MKYTIHSIRRLAERGHVVAPVSSQLHEKIKRTEGFPNGEPPREAPSVPPDPVLACPYCDCTVLDAVQYAYQCTRCGEVFP